MNEYLNADNFCADYYDGDDYSESLGDFDEQEKIMKCQSCAICLDNDLCTIVNPPISLGGFFYV